LSRSQVASSAGGLIRLYVFGLQALMLLPLTPLQSRSLRQSAAVWQTFTHVTAVPEIASQIEPSGHSLVDPVIVQDFVQ
jgi:hypothetical protein